MLKKYVVFCQYLENHLNPLPPSSTNRNVFT